jgi:hypothetical protein
MTGAMGGACPRVYDLNPVPADIKPRILATAINEDDGAASLALAMSVAHYFGLDTGKAREIANRSATRSQSGATRLRGTVSARKRSKEWLLLNTKT